MRTSKKVLLGLICVSGLAWNMFEHHTSVADAADHTEAPGTLADSPADIGDIYFWHNTQDNTLTVILTYAGPQAPAAGQSAVYDPDTIYGIHIDNTNDNIPNHNIWVRFAQNSFDEWGVQVSGLPGASGPVVGPVETTIQKDNTMVRAGLFDDPFFFDTQGFTDTIATETLAFDPNRDAFKGKNTSVIILEMPLNAAKGADDNIGVWATTGRI